MSASWLYDLASDNIDDWLPSYYQRLTSEYQFSLSRRDNITNWALTLFIAVIAAYVAILTSQTAVSSSLENCPSSSSIRADYAFFLSKHDSLLVS